MLNLIYAIDINNGFGKNNTLPWDLVNDRKFFSKLTTHNSIVMGKNTYNSLPTKYRPLPNRKNYILSSNFKNDYNQDLFNIQSIEDIINLSKEENVFVIGGVKLIQDIPLEKIDNIYETRIYDNYECDIFLIPHNKSIFKYISKSPIIKDKSNFQVTCYSKHNKFNFIPYFISSFNNLMPKSEETDYLYLLEKIFNYGKVRKTRNSSTYSLFSERLEFNIENNVLPLLTTKRTFWNGIIEELLWFIKGETDNKKLKEKGIHIWDGNTTNDFLKKSNLPYEEDICGPIYGYQWRRFGEEYTYIDKTTKEIRKTEGIKKGYDQLQEIINLIRNNPTSRRIFMSGWNPAQMSQMCLPPCHVSYQFYVDEDKLICQMYQRSADVFLGLPFNIASTSALTHLIAHHTGLKASRVIICLGDIHIYEEHLKAVAEQLTRYNLIKPFPTLEINSKYENIEDYSKDNFEIKNYQSENRIPAPMIA